MTLSCSCLRSAIRLSLSCTAHCGLGGQVLNFCEVSPCVVRDARFSLLGASHNRGGCPPANELWNSLLSPFLLSPWPSKRDWCTAFAICQPICRSAPADHRADSPGAVSTCKVYLPCSRNSGKRPLQRPLLTRIHLISRAAKSVRTYCGSSRAAAGLSSFQHQIPFRSPQ